MKLGLLIALTALFAALPTYGRQPCQLNVVGKVEAITPQKGVYFRQKLENTVHVLFKVQSIVSTKTDAEGVVTELASAYQDSLKLFLNPENAMEQEMLALLRSAGERDKTIRVILEHPIENCFVVDGKHFYDNVLAVTGIAVPRI